MKYYLMKIAEDNLINMLQVTLTLQIHRILTAIIIMDIIQEGNLNIVDQPRVIHHLNFMNITKEIKVKMETIFIVLHIHIRKK